jgi:hypothetical protein
MTQPHAVLQTNPSASACLPKLVRQKINPCYWLAAAAFAVLLMPRALLIERSTRNGQIGMVVGALAIARSCLVKAVSWAWKENDWAPSIDGARK